MKQQLKCYLCQGPAQKQYDQQSGICKKCIQQQQYIITLSRKQRSYTYPQIDYIDDGIYLGNQDAANDEDIIKQKNITAICVCGSLLEKSFTNDKRIIYKQFQIDDFPKQKILHMFPQQYQWMTKMKEQGRNILIHCAAGVSRSASFTIAYFMKKNNHSFLRTKSFIKKKRKCINPNSGFTAQLLQYQKQLGIPQEKLQQFGFI